MEKHTLPPHILPKSVRHIVWKRAFDIFFSLAVIFLSLPFMLLIILIIRCTSKGKAIYSHPRVGRGGKSFPCYKFRTMVQNADSRLHEILQNDPIMEQEWKDKRKLSKDPRITWIGAFLRRTSLDELPQFFNVLKGDLSVVGPRPVMEEELKEHFGKSASKVLSMRPGITGIWQVSGRSDTCYTRRVLMDEIYVDTCSFLLDIKLILKTIPKMLFAKGAY